MIGVCKKIYHEIVKLLTMILILGNAQPPMHLYIAAKEQFMAFCKITNSLTCKNRQNCKNSAINSMCIHVVEQVPQRLELMFFWEEFFFILFSVGPFVQSTNYIQKSFSKNLKANKCHFH